MKTLFHTGEFTDFKGLTHQFVIAGVVRKCHPDTYAETYDSSSWGEGIMYSDKDLEKFLSIGISICNPEDKFNPEFGKARAEGRALKQRKVELAREMFVTKGGMLSDDIVEAILSYTATILIKDPGQFIKGYNKAEQKWKEQSTLQS